jgi:hypothetical protein
MKQMKTVIPMEKFGNGNKLNSIFKNIFVNLNYVVSTVDSYFNLSMLVLKIIFKHYLPYYHM